MSSLPQTVKLQEKFELFTDHWSPKVVGELNGQQVKLVRISGEFVWHSHAQEDELFLVTAGSLRFGADGPVLGVGDLAVVPAGQPITLHNPGDEPAGAVVTIAAGFTATMADGTSFGTPPWAA